jgi:hypothetical protein
MELEGGQTMKMNRRSFLSTAAIAATSMTIHSSDAANQQAGYPTLGDSRDMFEAWFGPSTPFGDFVQFPQRAPGYPIYYARFVENRSIQVVGNFQTPDTPEGLNRVLGRRVSVRLYHRENFLLTCTWTEFWQGRV